MPPDSKPHPKCSKQVVVRPVQAKMHRQVCSPAEKTNVRHVESGSIENVLGQNVRCKFRNVRSEKAKSASDS